MFINLSNQSIIKIFICITGFTSVFVIISILIDKIRILLFEKIHINTILNKINNLLDLLLNKIESLIWNVKL